MMMLTPGMRNSVENLRRVLRNLHVTKPIDYQGLINGDSAALVQLLKHVICELDANITTHFSRAGYEFLGVNDVKFIESWYRAMRDMFNMRPNLTPVQFHHRAFAERKIDLAAQFLGFVLGLQQSRIRSHRLRQQSRGSRSLMLECEPRHAVMDNCGSNDLDLPRIQLIEAEDTPRGMLLKAPATEIREKSTSTENVPLTRTVSQPVTSQFAGFHQHCSCPVINCNNNFDQHHASGRQNLDQFVNKTACYPKDWPKVDENFSLSRKLNELIFKVGDLESRVAQLEKIRQSSQCSPSKYDPRPPRNTTLGHNYLLQSRSFGDSSARDDDFLAMSSSNPASSKYTQQQQQTPTEEVDEPTSLKEEIASAYQEQVNRINGLLRETQEMLSPHHKSNTKSALDEDGGYEPISSSAGDFPAKPDMEAQIDSPQMIASPQPDENNNHNDNDKSPPLFSSATYSKKSSVTVLSPRLLHKEAARATSNKQQRKVVVDRTASSSSSRNRFKSSSNKSTGLAVAHRNNRQLQITVK